MPLLIIINPVQGSATSTVTPLLASQIAIATKVLPLAHLLTPTHGESFKTLDEAFRRLQDWAFTQGFAVITESKRKDRVSSIASTTRRKRGILGRQ